MTPAETYLAAELEEREAGNILLLAERSLAAAKRAWIAASDAYTAALEAKNQAREAMEAGTAAIRCKCGKEGCAPHPCPYASEIHDDQTPCCAECADECALSI